ncbi:MAG: glycosyltransferase family 2 protein [Limisphaerales bacterium]
MVSDLFDKATFQLKIKKEEIKGKRANFDDKHFWSGEDGRNANNGKQSRAHAWACALMENHNSPELKTDAPEISLVIPCYNEEGNLRKLVKSIFAALEPLQISHEIVITDDCSQDGSWEALKELAAGDPRVRAQRFAVNRGKSAAAWAGMQASRGRHIVTLDADLQNDPQDVPGLLAALRDFDCANGTRVASRKHGDNFIRIASSRIANWVRNKLSGENISDAGCGIRAFKRECIANLKVFEGMHRFMPTLFKMEGYTVTEVPVNNHPRFTGQSKYCVWNRLFVSFYDLLAVRWMKRRMLKYDIVESFN